MVPVEIRLDSSIFEVTNSRGSYISSCISSNPAKGRGSYQAIKGLNLSN
jgi:hypothetical protein